MVRMDEAEKGTRERGALSTDGGAGHPPSSELGERETMLHLDVAGKRGDGSSLPSEAPGERWSPRSGGVIEGKYRLVDRIASGTMGSVWRAEHLALEVPVAIKFMHPSAAPDADVPRRFLREARIASALGGKHVAQVLDFGVEQERPYIVMELLRGESLARRLRRAGCLSPRQTAAVLVPLAEALQRVHELGVVHRDLKPENVFIVQVADREHPKLLDFGVAKVRKHGGGREGSRGEPFDVNVSRDTAEGELVGTPHYMSPEQARGATSVDHRCDVWALGVMAFECLLGYPPFVASGLGNLLLKICAQPLPVPSAFGAVPVGFDAWFARACAHLPDARFPTVLEAGTELQNVCAQERLEGPKRPARLARWRDLSRWLVRWGRRLAGPRTDRTLPRWFAAIAVISLLCGAAARATLGGSRASRNASANLDTGTGAAAQPVKGLRSPKRH